MTSAPDDLLAFRADVRAVTGLGAVDVGIVGDGAHQRTGGFHEGADVLRAIGRYHPPASAHIGSSAEDYSARQERDRRGLTNSSSATDVGAQWPSGGRSAWIRWNNLLFQEMRDRPQNVPALRAINVALDGKTKQRFDQLHRGDGLIPSTDTVDSHTHLEFWRDTENNRKATLDRIVALMRAAVTGANPPPVPATATPGDNDMAILAKDDTTGNHYLCFIGGFRSYPIDAKRVGDIKYLAKQGALTLAKGPGNNAEWEDDGNVRRGWNVAAFGPVETGPAPVQVQVQFDTTSLQALSAEVRQEVAAELAELRDAITATRRAAEANLSDAEKAALPSP